MTPSQKQAFLARLTAMNEGDPLWVGLQQLIHDLSTDTVLASSRPDLSADSRAYNDGRQSMALDLGQALEDAWVKAHQPPG